MFDISQVSLSLLVNRGPRARTLFMKGVQARNIPHKTTYISVDQRHHGGVGRRKQAYGARYPS